MPSADAAFELLICKLERLTRLTDADRAALQELPSKIEIFAADQLLVREGDRPADCCLLLGGYACRYKMTEAGDRQIVSFHMAGDLLDIQHLMLERADHSIATVTQAEVCWVPAANVKALLQARPAINEALWRDALIDASIFREWVLNVGRRSATSRIAHMLCELATRREAAGLGAPEASDLPLTRQQIAQATGLSTVHVTRVLGDLSNQRVLTPPDCPIRIIDWERMCQVGEFNGLYLHAA